jgi:hypothetical protein
MAEAVKWPGAGCKPAEVGKADVAMLTSGVRNVGGNADMNPKKAMDTPKTGDLCAQLPVKCK